MQLTKIRAARQFARVNFIKRSVRENHKRMEWVIPALTDRVPRTRGGMKKDRLTRIEYRYGAGDTGNRYSKWYLYEPAGCGDFYDV
jgi:hypothetical protein